jgi:hypothetical protein
MRSTGYYWSVAIGIAGVIAQGGCEASDDNSTDDGVDVATSAVTVNDVRIDPPSPGLPVTVCTVGGVTMHCCPEWQAGRLHYVMVGMNLSTNTFTCARLPSGFGNPDIGTPTLTSMVQTLDGETIGPVCPGKQAMLGYHFDQKKAVCAAFNDPLSVFPYLDTRAPVNGTKICQGGVTPGGANNAVMNGVSLNNPFTRYRCLH